MLVTLLAAVLLFGLGPAQEILRVSVLSVVAIAVAAGARALWRWFVRAVRRDLHEAIRDEVEPIVAEHVERVAVQLRDDGNGSFRNVVMSRLDTLEAAVKGEEP